VAAALSARLRGKGWSFAGTARDSVKTGMIEANGGEAVEWSDARLDETAFDGASAILISTPPAGGKCPAFVTAADAISARRGSLAWIGYLSTNGVYGDWRGAWVDETANLLARTERGKARIRAEAGWRALAVSLGLPLVIFRLPGIYGPGRSALDKVRARTARRIFKKDQVFNRMHVEDIAAALEASIKNPQAGGLFNLADDEPSPPQDVIEFACKLIGQEPPPLMPIETANLSPSSLSFYTDNKCVNNARMKHHLGVKLSYPTYREGLRAILAKGG